MKFFHLSLITLLLSTVTLSGSVAFILFSDLAQTLEDKGQLNPTAKVVKATN